MVSQSGLFGLSDVEVPSQKTKRCHRCKTTKTIDNFYKSKRTKDGLEKICIQCYAIKSRNNVTRLYDETHKEQRKARRIQREFGITIDEYYKRTEEQGFLCAICGDKLTSKKHSLIPSVDHDHESGIIRGILCGSCNRGLGLFRESSAMIAKAIEYLEKTDGNL